MQDNHDYIESIYNYCDRWCERCKYTDRCYSFQMEVSDGFDPLNTNLSDEEVWAYVGKRLAQAMEMLRATAVEEGIDLDNLPDVEEEPLSEKAARLEAEAKEINRVYVLNTLAFFKENAAYFEGKAHESINWVEMGMAVDEEATAHWERVSAQVEVIKWYNFFIGAKMQRAISGLDEMGKGIWDSPEQSDANRTARIVVLALERSMAGWQIILEAFPEKQDEIVQQLALLAKSHRLMVAAFPRYAAAGPDVVW